MYVLSGLVVLGSAWHERRHARRAVAHQRVTRSWERLFFYLARYGSAAALEHMRLSGSWPGDRLAYLAKYRVNALLGRVTNG